MKNRIIYLLSTLLVLVVGAGFYERSEHQEEVARIEKVRDKAILDMKSMVLNSLVVLDNYGMMLEECNPDFKRPDLLPKKQPKYVEKIN